MIPRAGRVLVWASLAIIALQVIGRQLTRTTWVPWLPESPLTLALIAAVAGAAGVVLHRRGPRAVVFATALACGLCLQLQFGARLQSDAFYYYAYLRSFTFDGDVSLANDYQMLGLGDKPHLFEPTRTGYAHSAWTVGPGIVWSPFFAVGHVAASRLASQGRDVATDGSSYPYRQSIVIAGLVYALLGWWFVLRLCEGWFNTRIAAGATALMAGGSFLLWYSLVEPTMTHAPSMAAVAGFLLIWQRTRHDRTRTQWVLMAVVAGLMTLIRWQNVLFALVPAVDSLLVLVEAQRRGDRVRLQRELADGALFTLVASVTFLPQMLAWNAIYGSWLAVSPVGPQIRLLAPEIALTLFSSRNGLLAMTPLLYVALAGLVALAWTRRQDAAPLLLAVLAMVWFNASVQDWWGSDGFGGRRFDGILPAATLGLAMVLHSARRLVAARPMLVVTTTAGVLIALNLTLVAAAQRGVVRLGEAASFGTVSAAQARIWHDTVGHVFSFPANYWFALRNGVGPAAYDRMAPSMFLGDPKQPTGRIDIGGDDQLWLGHGWFGPERDGDQTFRWATQEATLLVPLARTADLTVQVRLRAFTYPGAPQQQLTLHTASGTWGPVPVGSDWDAVTFETTADSWHAGLNRVRLAFSSATRPQDVNLGGDGRHLAAAVDVFRVTIR